MASRVEQCGRQGADRQSGRGGSFAWRGALGWSVEGGQELAVGKIVDIPGK